MFLLLQLSLKLCNLPLHLKLLPVLKLDSPPVLFGLLLRVPSLLLLHFDLPGHALELVFPLGLPTVLLRELRARWESLWLLQQLLVLVIEVLICKLGGGSHIVVPARMPLAHVGWLIRGLSVGSQGELIFLLETTAEVLDCLIYILQESAAPRGTANFLNARIHNLSYQTDFLTVSIGSEVHRAAIMETLLALVDTHQVLLELAYVEFFLFEFLHELRVNCLAVLLFDNLIKVFHIIFLFNFAIIRLNQLFDSIEKITILLHRLLLLSLKGEHLEWILLGIPTLVINYFVWRIHI